MRTRTYYSDVWYYCDSDGQLQGSVSVEQLEELARQGTITQETIIVPEATVWKGWNQLEKEIDADKHGTTLRRVAAIKENLALAQFLIEQDEERNGYRPRELHKEQMKDIQGMHERLARTFAAKLSAMLRNTVEVKLISVDQLTYSEFTFGLDNPTCFNLLRVEPIEGNMILDISPSIIYPMIDRMLGSERKVSAIPRQPLTDGELWLVKRMTDEFLKELTHVWKDVLNLRFSVVQVESNPLLLQVVAPREGVIYLCFEVEMSNVRGGRVRGCMSLCIPCEFFERIQNTSSDGTSMDTFLEKAEQKLQEVSQLLTDIRRTNEDTTAEPQS